MVDYKELFDVAYSNTLPESVKDSIIDKVLESIGEELNEDLSEKDSHYVVFLNTLVESKMSIETINSVLDKTFENVSEEVINEVSDAWKKAKATEYINRRKEQVDKMVKPQRSMLGTDTSPVGLSGFKRNVMNKEIKRGEDFIKKNVKSEAPQATQAAQSKPSAMDRLKSAVGKVKSWVDKQRGVDKPVGLSKLKQEKEERIKKAVEMGTGTKKAPKAAKVEQPKAEETQEAPKAEATKKKTTTTKKKSTTNKDIEQAQKEAENVEQPKEETSKKKTTTTAKKITKKTKEKLDKGAEEVAKTVEKPAASKKKTTTTKKTTTRASKKKTANEALEKFNSLLVSSNVSEAIIGEITEMISNKKAAEKAVERDYKEFSKAADALNKVEEKKAITGSSPVSPEQHKKMIEKAAEKGARYERFKALADKKFG